MTNTNRSTTLQILVALALLAPLLFLLLLPLGASFTAGLWLAMILLICIWMFSMMAAPMEDAQQTEERGPRTLSENDQPEIIRELMDVRVATEEAGVRSFRGRLHASPERIYERLKEASSGALVPLIQQDEQFGATILLMPRPVEQAVLERSTRPWLHWVLFGLTFLTTTWAGAMHQGVNLLREPERFAVGLPYAVGLLLILGVHELGHYFTARRHGMRVTPPYFIPVPFALGTFGAFIQMKSPPENRRVLFDVAVAGPLAGLAVAIPALLLGLESSTVVPGDAAQSRSMMHGTSVASSLLFALLSKFSLGDALEFGYVLRLSPLAFAGWLGLLVTALNLLPIGQLDGGHMARAMFGSRVGQIISSVAMWSLFLLAIFVWPGLLFWAIIVFFIAGQGTPPLNDLTPITSPRRWLGYGTFLVLVLILIPLPHAFWNAAGIYCPYM